MTATWITLVGLPVFLCNAIPSHVQPAVARRDYIGLGIYAGSLLFEVIADRQKSAWRKAKDNKEHDEAFISSGLWSISRHPKLVLDFSEIKAHSYSTQIQLYWRSRYLDRDMDFVNCVPPF